MKKILTLFTILALNTSALYSTRSYFINRIPNKKVTLTVSENMPEKTKFTDAISGAIDPLQMAAGSIAMIPVAIREQQKGFGKGTAETKIDLSSPQNTSSKSNPEWIDTSDGRRIKDIMLEIEGYNPLFIDNTSHLNQMNYKAHNKEPGLYVVIAEKNGTPVVYMSKRDKSSEKLFESCRDKGNTKIKDACQLGKDEPEDYTFVAK